MQKKCSKVKIKFLILVIVTNRGIKDNNNLHNCRSARKITGFYFCFFRNWNTVSLLTTAS